MRRRPFLSFPCLQENAYYTTLLKSETVTMGNGSEMINVPPQNSSPLPNLPEDIIKVILLRLPAKSLGKFRCVSKSWLFLLSSYEFAKAHLKSASTVNIHEPDRLIVRSGRFLMDLYTFSLRPTSDNTIYTGSIHPDVGKLSDLVWFGCPTDHHGGVCPVGSCNGLVCVLGPDGTVILWNPTTRKYRPLPCSGTYLAFMNCYCRHAFGYDELHDDYKVVEVLNLAQDLSLSGSQAKVYSLRNNCWKTLLNWPNGYIVSGLGVFFNGAIHWLVSGFRTPKRALLSHDLELDTIVEFSLPVTENYAVRFYIKVLGGCLSLCCEYGMYLDVWLLKEYGVVESWIKVVRIPLVLADYARPVPLLLMAEGKMLLRYESELCLYDPRDPHTHRFSNECTVEALTYFESLVSPNLDDEIIIGSTLPKNVITEILKRLPVKSLLRFKSVSKEWLSVISSSDFVKAHLKISTKNNVCLHDKLLFGSNTFPVNLYTCSIYSLFECSILCDSLYPATNENLPFNQVSFDCPFAESDDWVWLVGSCNGLVCVSLSSNIIILWNPATRKSKLIPNSGTDLDFDYYGVSYGFGCDELHNDYKVVEILGAENETGVYQTQVKTYSAKTNSWKIVSNWPGGDTFGGSGKFLNGAIHWSVWDLDRPADWAIVSQDLATDAFALLPLPDIDYNDVRVDVKIVNGCLAVSCEHKNLHMDIWVMTEYGTRESWTKLVHIPFFLDFRDHHFVKPCPLFLMDGKVLINYGSTIRVFDSSNSESHQFSTTFGAEAITFSESLVWPDVDDQIIFGRTLPQEIDTELRL